MLSAFLSLEHLGERSVDSTGDQCCQRCEQRRGQVPASTAATAFRECVKCPKVAIGLQGCMAAVEADTVVHASEALGGFTDATIPLCEHMAAYWESMGGYRLFKRALKPRPRAPMQDPVDTRWETMFRAALELCRVCPTQALHS